MICRIRLNHLTRLWIQHKHSYMEKEKFDKKQKKIESRVHIAQMAHKSNTENMAFAFRGQIKVISHWLVFVGTEQNNRQCWGLAAG